MKTLILLIALNLPLLLHAQKQEADQAKATPHIQIALLLDISSSMNKLLDQAQTQLWNLVNYIKQYELEGISCEVELAVLSYGGQKNEEQGYIKVISDFTPQIDTLVDQLFGIQIGGGEEYCGWAIQTALDSLSWAADSSFRCIFIAGNESFEQGPLLYTDAFEALRSRGIKLNTIYCGEYEQGIQYNWQQVLEAKLGDYAYIGHEGAVKYFETPYDNKIVQLYDDYQNTFLQPKEELNTSSRYSRGNISPVYRDQIIYKLKHQKVETDIIDLFEQQEGELQPEQLEQLPEQLRQLEPQKQKMKLFRMAQERSIIRESITAYIKKIDEYLNITVGTKRQEETLDMAMKAIMKKQLESFGYSLSQ